MAQFTIDDPDNTPEWLTEYQRSSRVPVAKADDRLLFRITQEDAQRFQTLSGFTGVEVLLEDGAVSDWNVLDEDPFETAFGMLWESARSKEKSQLIFEMESDSGTMTLVKYVDGVLSAFDDTGGTFECFDRRRVYATVEEAFSHPDEMFFEPADVLLSICSTMHSSEEIAAKLSWLCDVEAHEFTINGQPWRYDPDKGVSRVASGTAE
jgi:hypothetical protein